MKTIPLTVAVTLTLLAGCASRPGADLAHTPELGAIPEQILAADSLIFVEADGNDDRSTSREEIELWITQEWGRVSEGQPSITRTQLQDWTQRLFGPIDVAAQFGPLTFDRNLDRQITSQELSAEIWRRFVLRDANENGLVERGEVFVRLPRPSSMPRRAPPGGPPPGGRPPGM